MNQFFNMYFWNVQGRVTRAQYWAEYFIVMLVYVTIIAAIINIGAYMGGDLNALIKILIVGLTPAIWSGVIVSIKRIRDTGLSPWWYILQLIPYLGIIAGLVFTLVPTNYFPRHKTREVIV